MSRWRWVIVAVVAVAMLVGSYRMGYHEGRYDRKWICSGIVDGAPGVAEAVAESCD